MLVAKTDRRARRRPGWAAITIVTCICAVLLPTASGGQAPTTGAADEETTATVPDDLATIAPAEVPGVDAVLDGVSVETTGAIRRADEVLAAALGTQQTASLQLITAQMKRQEQAIASANADQLAADAAAHRLQAQQDLDAAKAELAEREAREDELRAVLREEQDRLRAMAARLLATASDDQYALLGSLEDFTEADRRAAARDRGVTLQSEAVDAAQVPWEQARDRRIAQQERTDDAAQALEAAVATQADADATKADAAQQLDGATKVALDAQTSLDAARDGADDALAERRLARLDARVDGAPFDLVALHAYWRAAQLAPCRIPWWLLAGVGRVETGHGTAHGSRVTPEGDTTVHIVGIPLDGRPGTARVGDTDGGSLDGDGAFDRAVGPMQFLPGTWRVLGADGNGDGEKDPHNLYDAAAAAAGLLCLGRGDLLTEPAMRTALLSYNNSGPYGALVVAEGATYRDALDLPEIPPRPGDSTEGE